MKKLIYKHPNPKHNIEIWEIDSRYQLFIFGVWRDSSVDLTEIKETANEIINKNNGVKDKEE